jgi:UDP-2,3-diacylglucosamine pyrophosphatase LpxH
MLDAICISDIHLGSVNCCAKEVCGLLEDIDTGIVETRRLIINGDLFDSIEFRRLKKRHWKVLTELRKLSDKIEVVWVKGNHDIDAHDCVSHLIGTVTCKDYVFESGDKRVLIVHGDIFDKFITKHPTITWMADWFYHIIQQIDPTRHVGKFLKRRSKTFLRCTKLVEERAVKMAEHRDCQIVCCGHTHLPVMGLPEAVQYCNSGCWVESPPTYLTIHNGKVELQHYVR